MFNVVAPLITAILAGISAGSTWQHSREWLRIGRVWSGFQGLASLAGGLALVWATYKLLLQWPTWYSGDALVAGLLVLYGLVFGGWRAARVIGQDKSAMPPK